MCGQVPDRVRACLMRFDTFMAPDTNGRFRLGVYRHLSIPFLAGGIGA